MTSILDLPEFNRALFYARPDSSPTPPGASDLFVNVPAARLHVRRYAPGRATKTLLLFHGNGEVVADYDDSAGQFADAGLALVVADYRGYGESTGTATLRHLIEDAQPIAELIQPTIVMGRSLGGAAAHELYAHPTASIAAIVLESAFSDLGALIMRRGFAPPRAYSAGELAMFDPGSKLRGGRLPLLVLHGERDDLVVPAEAHAAHDAAGGIDKRLVFVPARGHNDISLSPVYWQALAAFASHL